MSSELDLLYVPLEWMNRLMPKDEAVRVLTALGCMEGQEERA